MKTYKILCVGPIWRGSNAGGMFRALSRIGQLISVVDENYYINLSNRSFKVKALDKLFRSWHIKEFNKAIINETLSFKPDFVLVYKGAFILPETLQQLRSNKIYLVNFYPDVSFRTHGSLLAKTLPLYDHIFTTKTFGIKDMKEQLGISSSTFIPHGFDPDIHRRINFDNLDINKFSCDISFVGGWSVKKEKLLLAVKQAYPNANLKIWGPRWENCYTSFLKPSIMYESIMGDLYTTGILCSSINLGLLHERVEGASSGDLITSRTFHIPGAGGFMIHERTDEVKLYFEEDKEIVCFQDANELVEKVGIYLKDKSAREKIAEAGYKRALRDHSLDSRARIVISQLERLLNA